MKEGPRGILATPTALMFIIKCTGEDPYNCGRVNRRLYPLRDFFYTQPNKVVRMIKEYLDSIHPTIMSMAEVFAEAENMRKEKLMAEERRMSQGAEKAEEYSVEKLLEL